MLPLRSLFSLVVIAVSTFIFARPSWAASPPSISVEEAYAANNHSRTVFDPIVSSLDRSEAYKLSELFALTDQAVIRQAEMIHWLRSKGEVGIDFPKYKQEIEFLSAQIDALAQVKQIDFVKYFIRKALDEQLAYFEERTQAVGRGQEYHHVLEADGNENARVVAAHRYLSQAYDMLVKAFPKEEGSNREALKDYLSALDLSRSPLELPSPISMPNVRNPWRMAGLIVSVILLLGVGILALKRKPNS